MRRFFQQARLDFKGHSAAFELEEFLLLKTLYPFVNMVFYCIMAGYAFHTENLTDWVIGNAFLLCTYTCVFSLGGCFMGERYYGRIRSIVTAPVSKIELILEKGFFPCIVCMVTTFIGFGAGCIVFGISWKGVQLGTLLLVLVSAMLAASAFGMFLGTIGLLSDQMNLILNLVSYILTLFCGANFPVSQLPVGVRWISQILPLTRSIQAAKNVMIGKTVYDVMGLVISEIVLAVCYLFLSVGVVRVAERMAIRKGQLDLF